ncbi:unnamed protein product [Echinostoma caproni]|uniref:Transposase n=1 Tax=Echinostoma caproni TaxID=27848 RepID=A0A183AV30_9TREM|nr:unnamed protein product [Echinostoma caproni]
MNRWRVFGSFDSSGKPGRAMDLDKGYTRHVKALSTDMCRVLYGVPLPGVKNPTSSSAAANRPRPLIRKVEAHLIHG